MGFSFRIGHAGHQKHSQPTKRATPNDSCQTGGFFEAPAFGASVDSLQLVPLKWDTTCLDTTNVDIYANCPSNSSVGSHVWNNIPFAKGEYSIELQPKWWGDGPSAQFIIVIVPAGTPPALSTLPAGPVFTATYTAPADGKLPPGADMSYTGAAPPKTHSGVSAGGKAAAVLIPLLLIIGLGVAYFVRRQRLARDKQTKRFSEALDKRMSTISTNWQSISAAGAQHAIRNSIATGGRNSMAIPRPLSSYDDLPMPGEDGAPQMQQVRTGTGVGLRRDPASIAALANERASRVSRVSFAADTINRTSRASAAFTDGRPSIDSRKNRPFHQGYVPPLPNRSDLVSSVYPDSTLEKEEYDEKQSTGSTNSPVLSPRQKEGALPLNPSEISEKVHARNDSGQSTMGVVAYGGYEEVGAALSLVQTNYSGNASNGHVDFPVPMPASPAPTYTTSPGHHDNTFDDAYGSYPYPTSTTTSAFSPSVYGQMPTPPAPAAGGHAVVIPNVLPSINPVLPASSMAMSPDEMLRAYAERRGTPGPQSGASTPISSPPPSSFSALPGGGSPKSKGRKLSLRKSLAVLKQNTGPSSARPITPSNEDKKSIISQPTPIADAFGTTFRADSPSQMSMSPVSTTSSSANMAGVGARKNSQERWNNAANDVVGAPPPAAGQWKGAQYTIGEDEED